MATVHPLPEPLDPEVEALLRDPAFVARLDNIRSRLKDGTLELHHDDEARAIVGLEPKAQP